MDFLLIFRRFSSQGLFLIGFGLILNRFLVHFRLFWFFLVLSNLKFFGWFGKSWNWYWTEKFLRSGWSLFTKPRMSADVMLGGLRWKGGKCCETEKLLILKPTQFELAWSDLSTFQFRFWYLANCLVPNLLIFRRDLVSYFNFIGGSDLVPKHAYFLSFFSSRIALEITFSFFFSFSFFISHL